MSAPKPPPPRSDEPPHATITKHGRWRWNVIIRDGMTQYGPGGGPWVAWGSREHARRKARRKLASYTHMLTRRSDVEVVK